MPRDDPPASESFSDRAAKAVEAADVDGAEDGLALVARMDCREDRAVLRALRAELRES